MFFGNALGFSMVVRGTLCPSHEFFSTLPTRGFGMGAARIDCKLIGALAWQKILDMPCHLCWATSRFGLTVLLCVDFLEAQF